MSSILTNDLAHVLASADSPHAEDSVDTAPIIVRAPRRVKLIATGAIAAAVLAGAIAVPVGVNSIDHTMTASDYAGSSQLRV